MVTSEEKGYILGGMLTIIGTIGVIAINSFVAGIMAGIGLAILWWTMEVNE